jgi:hypothetical protein
MTGEETRHRPGDETPPATGEPETSPACGRPGLVEAARLRRGHEIIDEDGGTLTVARVQVRRDGFARIRWAGHAHQPCRMPASHLVPVRNVTDAHRTG